MDNYQWIKLLKSVNKATQEAWLSHQYQSTLYNLTVCATIEYVAQTFQ